MIMFMAAPKQLGLIYSIYQFINILRNIRNTQECHTKRLWRGDPSQEYQEFGGATPDGILGILGMLRNSRLGQKYFFIRLGQVRLGQARNKIFFLLEQTRNTIILYFRNATREDFGGATAQRNARTLAGRPLM